MNRIYRNTTDARFRDRADRAYYRYIGNIKRTKTYKSDLDKVNNSPNMFAMGRNNDALLNRQYSRNTYMGNSNG